ncbi:MAG: glycosyl transferase, partial [Thermodesulfobacteriota bacterium]
DTMRRYSDDAVINDLLFDMHSEGVAIETFVKALRIASKSFLEDPLGSPLIPNWNRVTSAIPDILEQLKRAVEKDNGY